MNRENNGLFGEEKSRVSVSEGLSKYLAKWPLFIVCLVVCVGIGLLYIYNSVPKYIATTIFLIKGAEYGEKNTSDLIEAAMNGKRQVNLNNEMLLIGSSSLMERTVSKNGFNVSYFKKGSLLNIDIYKDAPFDLVVKNITDSNRTYKFHLENINASGGNFSYTDKEKKEKSGAFKWNEPLTISGQSFALVPKNKIQAGDGDYLVRWQPVKAAASELTSDFIVKAYDTKTSVIQLTLKTGNLQRGKDVLNALFYEFNLSDIEDRNRLSDSTVSFINDRLVDITNELKGVEGNLESYQGSRQLADIKGQSAQSLENSSEVAKTIKDINIQQGVVNMITEYFANPASSRKLVPSSLGLNDPTLSSLITQYNELHLKRERELPSNAPNSLVIQDMDTQISNLKSSITESLNNITKNLMFQENSFQQQNRRFTSFLSSLPHNERVLQEIKRKQSITEGLYLYLLQKREEAAISSTTSNVANYKQIDPAVGRGPVEPNSRNIIIYTSLLGFFLAFGWIYIHTLLNDKITSREDVLNRTSLPILGEISHLARRKRQIISVLDRNITGEQFRSIRTNISFLGKNNKTVLVTSTISNEGKSFISLNYAAVCAMPGKKVAYLEFDIRRPAIRDIFPDAANKGLTDYLTGDVQNLSDIVHVLEEIPGLHIFPSGSIPLHPADLLLTGKMNHLFEALREEYDYIIIDSPPAGVVSDPFILGKYSDIVLYVVRYQKTIKKQLDFINEAVANRTLNNVTLILNDKKKANNDNYAYAGDYNYNGHSNGIKKVKKQPDYA